MKKQIFCNCEICGKTFYTRGKKKSKLKVLSMHFHLSHPNLNFIEYANGRQIVEIPKCKICNKDRKRKLRGKARGSIVGLGFYATCGDRECIRKSRSPSEEVRKKLSESRKKYLKSLNGKALYFRSRETYWEKYFRENVLEKEKLFEKYKIIQEYRETPYQLDFAIFGNDCKIDLEIDGWQHFLESNISYDDTRNKKLEANGWIVYRISCKDLKYDFENEKFKFLNFLIDQKFEKFDQMNYSNTRILKYRETLLEKNIEKKEKLLNSNIDFSKFGWVTEASNLIDVRHQEMKEWMKKNMPDFYEKNCFKKLTR